MIVLTVYFFIHMYTHKKMYIEIVHNYCRTMRNEIKIQNTMYGGK